VSIIEIAWLIVKVILAFGLLALLGLLIYFLLQFLKEILKEMGALEQVFAPVRRFYLRHTIAVVCSIVVISFVVAKLALGQW
jgi:hypothetical protein